MATHSSSLAWKIPWMEEPAGLQSMGPQRVGHNSAMSLSFTFTPLLLNLGALTYPKLMYFSMSFGSYETFSLFLFSSTSQNIYS